MALINEPGLHSNDIASRCTGMPTYSYLFTTVAEKERHEEINTIIILLHTMTKKVPSGIQGQNPGRGSGMKSSRS